MKVRSRRAAGECRVSVERHNSSRWTFLQAHGERKEKKNCSLCTKFSVPEICFHGQGKVHAECEKQCPFVCVPLMQPNI